MFCLRSIGRSHVVHAALSTTREQALLAKSTADRALQQLEQELRTLTAADQPDATAIEAKITEIAKLTGDARFAFILAVGAGERPLSPETAHISYWRCIRTSLLTLHEGHRCPANLGAESSSASRQAAGRRHIRRL
jgi:hypothetical protein